MSAGKQILFKVLSPIFFFKHEHILHLFTLFLSLSYCLGFANTLTNDFHFLSSPRK